MRFTDAANAAAINNLLDGDGLPAKPQPPGDRRGFKGNLFTCLHFLCIAAERGRVLDTN